MRMGCPSNVGIAVQTDPTLLCYPSAINGTTEISGVDWFQTLRNDSQQHAITVNRVCKRRQHLTSNIAGVVGPMKSSIHIFSPTLLTRLTGHMVNEDNGHCYIF